MSSKLSAKYKPYLLPLFAFLIVFVLTLTVGKLLFEKLLEIQSSISKTKQTNGKLQAKADLLASINLEELSQNSKLVLDAIPGEDSSLLSINSVRHLAQDKGLQVSDFKASSKEGKGKNSQIAELNITVSGSLSSMLSFLNEIKNSSPLMKLSKISLTFSGSSASAELTINSLWGSLPTTLPKVDEPVEAFRTAEQDILRRLATLKRPGNVEFSPLAPQGRTNPFTY